MFLFYSFSRGGLITDEEKLETCDGPDAGEIRKRKKKKSKTEQVTVPAAEATQEHGRFVQNFDDCLRRNLYLLIHLLPFSHCY